MVLALMASELDSYIVVAFELVLEFWLEPSQR